MQSLESPAEDVWDKPLPDDWHETAADPPWCELPRAASTEVTPEPPIAVPPDDESYDWRSWVAVIVAGVALVVALLGLVRTL